MQSPDALAPTPTGPHPVDIARTLPELLADRAAAAPDHPAVISDDATLTVAGLYRAACRVGAGLRALGVRPDDRIGVYADPSPELLVAIWGILCSGAAYLPLSPDYPEDRIQYMIADADVRVVLTQDHLRDRLREFASPATRIVTSAQLPEPSPEPPRGAASPTGLAYVIYTSGSTGRPKGVMIEHRSVLSQMRWMNYFGHVGPHTAVLQKTPVSFDAAQWEILAPAVGGRVVVGAPGIYRDPEALVDTVIRHDVTTLQCVPTLLRALLDTERFAECTSLQRVFSGGEALSVPLARELLRTVPECSLVNLYGPTECTINATAHLVDPDDLDDEAASVPIGTPVDNTQCYILDADLAPVDIGETGELYVGGAQLARGYLGRADLTGERFIPSPFVPTERLYRTGDLVRWNPDGTIQFCGRADNQVKLRGYRVELEEVTLAVENHTWVRQAAALVADDPRTGSPQLVACVELNPAEAAVMDQGNHGSHHQSKASRLQVRAQLADPGIRGEDQLAGRPAIALPGRQETPEQRRKVFARKTYRFYDGGPTTRDDLLRLLAAPAPRQPRPRQPRDLGPAGLGAILRWFGQFHSEQRLLPKYSYASPGSLYAAQLYLELSGVDDVPDGVYYYHPADHRLVLISAAAAGHPGIRIHLAGRHGAIEPVYRNNIREVLEIEAGHLIGVFADILPDHGLAVRPAHHDPAAKNRLDIADEDHYLGTFDIVPDDGETPWLADTEIYVQAHPGAIADLPAGQYRCTDGRLERLGDELLQAKHVIAINQQVYARASLGISAVSRARQPWLRYVVLGTALHQLQSNDLGFGFMSSGYSSETGHPLPAARRLDDILTRHGIEPGPSYFFVGGRVSADQLRGEDMREDAVHMKGPAELIRDELAATLPDYMIPNRVLVLDRLPRTANGKIDTAALARSEQVTAAGTATAYVAPATPTEQRLAKLWGAALRYAEVSTMDDFFAVGGNSLVAVKLINTVNAELGTQLPIQVLFEAPRLADLAARIDDDHDIPVSRTIPLHAGGTGTPVFCWPGLGGYPMNLRALGQESGRPFHGIQAHGINPGETPFATIAETAAADLAEIRRVQPEGPYSLWGYSFGARVAFETAWQLEQAGQQVRELVLICPGNPTVSAGRRNDRTASYRNPVYVTILFSVFTGRIDGPELDDCLAHAHDEDSFADAIARHRPGLDEDTVRRIIRIVAQTYQFDYTFDELSQRRLAAPVTLLKATGDDYSFIEETTGYSAAPPRVVTLAADHYEVLREPAVHDLVAAINGAAPATAAR
ncbi:non-ribosomal peptide synthetase family protein [Amycolatopsis dendrobii]|uniref:Amino acid adenylation domain-containing protein n=1 Tax=Amycolatopsis dendrobii TaxID=2760662 RepID=A0A7W3W6X2_9PSEU|nr:amino acid adenylation domain-containing protein [Amycolatopsis dendrobii]MBB1159377.1 amino acid adenylation domain-containing protein [Amycolatopsis dendrobii]